MTPVKARFEALSETYLKDILALVQDTVRTHTPEGSSLVSMVDYQMDTGGKRLRALLPLMVGEALGMHPRILVPFGAACEMLHNATLVHDDLQDGDDTRRGRATVWRRFGAPQAINLGDAMFYYTLLLAQKLDLGPSIGESIAQKILTDTLRVIDGQEREFLLKSTPEPHLGDYFAMVEGKTSGLFALPIAGTALLAGSEPGLVKALDSAAGHLGVLFQIQDDVLDLYGEKGRGHFGSDIAEGKRSFLAVHGLAHADAQSQKKLRAILDKDRAQTTPDDIAWAKELFRQQGALDAALQEIEARRQQAVRVRGLSEHPTLPGLLGQLADLFLAPIRPLIRQTTGPRTTTGPQKQAEEDVAFCQAVLPRVSRSFALSIQALPYALGAEVRAAYLLCRLVDTIEDEPRLDGDRRQALFDAFDAALVSDQEGPASAFEHAVAPLGADGAEGELCQNAGAVFRCFRALSPEARDAIRPHVLEMSQGMREYTVRAQKEGGLRLRDVEDLERYCHFVAGTVGDLLTKLFERSVNGLPADAQAQARLWASSFGTGLQLVNILKDIAPDFERHDCYLPTGLAAQYGLPLDELLDPTRRQAALTVVDHLLAHALRHLDRALRYTLLWPKKEGAHVRLFCAVPLALAFATLAEIRHGENTLKRGREPKVSRQVTVQILKDAQTAVLDDHALERLLKRHRDAAWAPTPKPHRTSPHTSPGPA